jgi:hypothetical protein
MNVSPLPKRQQTVTARCNGSSVGSTRCQTRRYSNELIFEPTNDAFDVRVFRQSLFHGADLFSGLGHSFDPFMNAKYIH